MEPYGSISMLMASSYCFICDNLCPQKPDYDRDFNNGLQNPGCSPFKKFFKLACRYLNFDCDYMQPGQTWQNGDKLLSPEEQICEECYPALNSFCEMYDLLSVLKLEMNWHLEQIGKTMEVAANARNKSGMREAYQQNLEANRTNLGSADKPEGLDKFRRKFRIKAIQKGKQSFPQLKIKRSDTHITRISPSSTPRNFMRPVKSELREEELPPKSASALGFETNLERSMSSQYSTQANVYGGPPRTVSSVDPVQNDKPFSCRFCGKKFTRRYSVKKHVNTHTEIRRFRCSFCNKRFTQSSNLTRHENAVHRGIRPYGCSICEHFFGQRQQLQRHYRRHHTSTSKASRFFPRRKTDRRNILRGDRESELVPTRPVQRNINADNAIKMEPNECILPDNQLFD